MRSYLVEIFIAVMATMNMVGCLHFESGVGDYNYQSKHGAIKGVSEIQKVGVQNIVAKGVLGVGAGLMSTRYSNMFVSEKRNSWVDTSGSYFGLSLGTNFGRQKNHSIFAEVNRVNESYPLFLFQKYSDSNDRGMQKLQFRSIASNQYAIGYRFSLFWKDKPLKKSSKNGSSGGMNFSGGGGDGAAIILGIALVYLATEAIARSIEKTAHSSNINSLSFHMKYNYRHAILPEDALLRGMDSRHNELYERSVTAGFVIDWL